MKQRTTIIYDFSAGDLPDLKAKMLNWLRPFSIFAYLDNNGYSNAPNRFELVRACDPVAHFRSPDVPLGDWAFGHLGYDFKNKTDPALHTRHPRQPGPEDCFFFIPETVCFIPFGKNELHIESISRSPGTVLDEILSREGNIPFLETERPNWRFPVSREDYLQQVRKVIKDIEEGDYYELNFCTEVISDFKVKDPFGIFNRLNHDNPAPFAAFYRNGPNFLVGASPERFLYKTNSRIFAQPIKGTCKRSPHPEEDKMLRDQLQANIKERAENVMIADLMRNDLARCCLTGTVQVPELFGVYTFPTLHHLISTISGTLDAQLSFHDIIKFTFPMGSMTGAPKKIVMERIDRYEAGRRGFYSGTLGYIMPEGDFDLNVVIRSLFYNEDAGRLTYHTGGAITYDSIPEQEWQEMKLKSKAMESVFEL
jgi:para-aminobenzoate synthetase component 1